MGNQGIILKNEFSNPRSLRQGGQKKGAQMKTLITKDTPVSDEVLNAIAYFPTKSLPKIVDDAFFKKLSDKDFMRLAFLLAYKGYEEGGCPIGGVIIRND